jgi:hypothetical protein
MEEHGPDGRNFGVLNYLQIILLLLIINNT